jgi:hypothetical protein
LKIAKSRMTLSASVRRRIQSLGPYQSLALLALPLAIVEPLKFVALLVCGRGHWLTGMLALSLAYVLSLIFIERLFHVVRPKLMTMPWFSESWQHFVAIRDKVSSYFTRRTPKAMKVPPKN